MRRSMPEPAALDRSLCSMERSRFSLSRSRRPITLIRIDCSTQRRVSVNRYWPNRCMSAAISAGGRTQFAEEKAYSVSTSTSARAVASTMARTAFAPSMWPAVRGSPRWAAQRPFPSMIIATCTGSTSPRRLDNRLDVLEVAQQGLLADRRNVVFRPRSARLEGFRAHHIAGFFELAGMGAQVAVAHVEQRLEFVECQLLVHGQCTHDAEAHPFVYQAIETRVLIGMRRPRPSRGFCGR